MKTENPIILIDGSYYLYRAFFALRSRSLTNSKGEPTGAIYGVTNMIRSLLKQYQPTHIAVVFDAKGGSFRKTLYPDYKATRDAMPEDLRVQVEPIHTILKAMGLPLLCIDNVEADDVIGTLAKQAEVEGLSVLISTGDKDMAQLVSDKVTLINTMDNVILDPHGVEQKYGVPPSKIIDYLALMGDSSDNIPGVPGVGGKIACSLLTEFNSIDDIYNNIDNVATLAIRGAKSIQKKLIENEKDARLSYLLATIKTDVALNFSSEQLKPEPANIEKLKQIFEYHGFNRWLTELNHGRFIKSQLLPANQTVTLQPDNHVAKTDPQQTEKNYETILTSKQLDNWVEKLTNSDLIAFDTETNNVDHFHAQLVGISFSVSANNACYIPIHHHYLGVPKQLALDEVISKLKPVFENKNIKKVGQNVKFDYAILANYGINVQGIAYDTMLESYVLNSNDHHDLDNLAHKHLHVKKISYDELTKIDKKKLTIDQIDIEKTTRYASEDADLTLMIHHKLWPELKQNPKLADLFNHIELPLAIILANMERTGVLIDESQLRQYSKDIQLKLNQLEQQIHELAGEKFNIASPKQLQVILFEKNQLPIIRKTPKGAPSTNEEVLSELANDYELPRLILEYRGLAKLKNTYTDKLPLMISPVDHRVHTNYKQIGTVTGRLSSNYPNLQNIPVRNEEGRKIRQAFIAPKGYKIVSADYSQIELRIMAHLSRDKNLLDAFINDKDIHRFTASEILGKAEQDVTSEERRRAKAVNFGLIYGMSAFGLSGQISIPINEAKFYIDRYFERYPGVEKYMENTRQLASEKGYVETLSGRRLYLPKINSSSGLEKRAAERAAINAPMQGTAADIIKSAMIAVNDYIQTQENNVRMVMQVHDELVFEVKEEHLATICKQIQTIMENCYQLDIPLKVDVGYGNNWDEAH